MEHRSRRFGSRATEAGETRLISAQGYELNREIAQAIFVTVKTVETHLASAFRKLEISSRGELAAALDSSS